jgi:UbiD family decarboxylase
MREYIAELRQRGDLVEIDTPVNPEFELAAVTQRLQKESDRAILFHNVVGTSMPVVSNVYGSRQRLCELIGAEDGNFCRRWNEMHPGKEPLDPPAQAAEFPRISGGLGDLPRITYFEKDGGPYITSALFVARHPDTGVANLSFHRSQFIAWARRMTSRSTRRSPKTGVRRCRPRS